MSLLLLPLLLPLYLLLVRLRRHRLLHTLTRHYGTKYNLSPFPSPSSKPRMLDSYTGIRDAQRILRLVSLRDCPFLFTKSLEFALFKTYGIPTISQVLVNTGQFSKRENAPRRFIDTSLLIQGFLTYPLPRHTYPSPDTPPPPHHWETLCDNPTDPRSAIALARVNYLHARHRTITNDDMLYTLSLFILEPPKWLRRYEWRAMTPLEEEALFTVMVHVGRCMGIQHIPETRGEMLKWSSEYEERENVYAESNAQTAEHTLELLVYRLPEFAKGFARQMAVSLMEDRLRASFGLALPSRPIVWIKDAVLRARMLLLRHFFLPRRTPLSGLPIEGDDSDAVFSVERVLQASLGVCPASGALASEGKTCPVGNHAEKLGPAATNAGAMWRMEPKWYENEPIYSRPFDKGSWGWWVESVKVRLGALSPEEKRGAQKWRAATLPQHPAGPVKGLGGFRLEELGPKGLEMKGRAEVLKNAEELYGGPLEGRWAFTV
ncbi:hypothetical protein ACQY0O_005247 [Thecaphora frezii]